MYASRVTKKLNKCTSPNGRHKYVWLKNFTEAYTRSNSKGTSARFILKGQYQCSICNISRVGQPHHDGPDLRRTGTDLKKLLDQHFDAK